MLLVLGATTGAFAQKPGGILQLQHFDSPASMSILEEATRASEQPVMGAARRMEPMDDGKLNRWRLFAELTSEDSEVVLKACEERILVGVEELFHEVGEEAFAVPFSAAPGTAEALRSARLERAIGVIYRPDTERQSHYFRARLADQFDVVIHIDDTRAVEPIERTAGWERGEVPETFPHAV